MTIWWRVVGDKSTARLCTQLDVGSAQRTTARSCARTYECMYVFMCVCVDVCDICGGACVYMCVVCVGVGPGGDYPGVERPQGGHPWLDHPGVDPWGGTGG